jgi:hypothetical protein
LIKNSQNIQIGDADLERFVVEHKILNTFLQAMGEIVKITKSYTISTNDSITIDSGDICLQIMFVLKK